MAIGISVRSNAAELARDIDGLQADIERKALVSALNRTATTVRAEAVREIRAEYKGFKARVIRDAMNIERAFAGKLTAAVVVSGRRIPLIELMTSANRRGVRVRVKGGTKLIPHAFVTTLRSGHKGIFVRAESSKGVNIVFRRGEGSRVRPWPAHDLPITELTTLSLPTAFLQKKVQAKLDVLASDAFNKNFARELAFRVSRG